MKTVQQILKTLALGFVLFASPAFAQDFSLKNSFGFSTGISFGFPLTVHYIAQNVIAPGLGWRIDGGILMFLVPLPNVSTGLEYRFNPGDPLEVYAGANVVALFVPSPNDGLKFGVGGYLGFQYNIAFVELGVTHFFQIIDVINLTAGLRFKL
jgi:hypothetical protein